MRCSPVFILPFLLSLARAEIIGIEQFDYTDGVIAGKSGGTFWDYRNFSPTGHTGTVSNWDNTAGTPAVFSGRLTTSNSGAKREYHGTPENDGAVNDPASAPSSVRKTVYYRVTFTTGQTVPDFVTASSMDFTAEIARFGKDAGVAQFGITLFAPPPTARPAPPPSRRTPPTRSSPSSTTRATSPASI